MLWPRLDDALLATLRADADPAAYDRLLHGARWDAGWLVPRWTVRQADDGEAPLRMLKLLADAPAASVEAPALRAAAPDELELAGPGAIDLGCVGHLTALTSLRVSDAASLGGLAALATLPALARLELVAVAELLAGERLVSASLRELRAPELHRVDAPGTCLIAALADVPALTTLATRARALDDVAALVARAPRLATLTLHREQPVDLAPLARLPLTELALVISRPRLAELPAMRALRALTVVTLPPGLERPVPPPISLDLHAAQPALVRLDVAGPVAALGALPPGLGELELELAPGFEVTDPGVVPGLTALSLRSSGWGRTADMPDHDLGFLRRFPNLRRLRLAGGGWRTLAALASCPALASVELHMVTSATDVSYLLAHPEIELRIPAIQRDALGLPPAR